MIFEASNLPMLLTKIFSNWSPLVSSLCQSLDWMKVFPAGFSQPVHWHQVYDIPIEILVGNVYQYISSIFPWNHTIYDQAQEFSELLMDRRQKAFARAREGVSGACGGPEESHGSKGWPWRKTREPMEPHDLVSVSTSYILSNIWFNILVSKHKMWSILG